VNRIESGVIAITTWYKPGCDGFLPERLFAYFYSASGGFAALD